jgi:hypothetical protein
VETAYGALVPQYDNCDVRKKYEILCLFMKMAGLKEYFYLK